MFFCLFVYTAQLCFQSQNEIRTISLTLHKTTVLENKDHKVRTLNWAMLEETMGKTIQDVDMVKGFLNKRLAAQETLSGVAIWDSMELKSICTAKGAITSVTRWCSEWEEISSIVSSIYEELKIFRHNPTANQ